ncbi:MAG: HAMP domain-containing sensor histidine kinase [Nitrospiraceae bacterium]|nr:HAMP domain-containing sensor histidine kinase [Nitrospiraceae bacterium]
MRTKLFLAFFAVISIALISNLIYEYFITRDFGEYASGAREDKLYWVLASVEGSYRDDGWDERSLHEAVHWAVMLGFDTKIEDAGGRTLVTSMDVMGMLSPAMRRRMQGMVNLDSGSGEFESYPLYMEGREIGTMYARPLISVGSASEKEMMFKRRGREFLYISFAIAGGGAVFLSVIFILFLSRPLNRLKDAVEALGSGDFSIRVADGSGRDEVSKLAGSFNFMAEALQREEALRKHLTSNIAHELRTPLAVMKANVEAMVDGVVEDRDTGLEHVRMEIEKLIMLVAGIEDITKAEASFFAERRYTGVDLPGFLAGMLSKLQPLAAEKGLRMRLVSERPLHVFTDADKLERIMQNVLANAIRYTDRGGVWVDYGSEKKMFFVEVRDSGEGIPADRLGDVFRRFYRGSGSSGIGLGLAIVKELVDVMGGRIDVKSAVGEGSVFRVWLPVKDRT